MLKELREYDLIGLPRLVRLNPNVPWKTRGNAAVCLPLGRGVGTSDYCGEIDGIAVQSYRRGTPADPKEVLAVAEAVLEREAEFDCDKTNPGIVCTNRRPSPRMYWRAVRGIVSLSEAETLLDECGAQWRKYKNGRGIIGASSSISWRPRDRTWEVIAYRQEHRIGTRREIDPLSVVEMDRNTVNTFNNYDYETEHVAIAPSSPCPVLFGIRGDSLDELLSARKMIRGEAPSSWLAFLSNQGTDDHVVDARIGGLSAGFSARVRACVTQPPRTIKGGHVILRVSDGREIDAAFYEPSGSLRDIARQLIPGDRIIAHGAVRDDPRSLNVEKLRIVHLAELRQKTHNPYCPECSKRMGSMGAGKGYRCKICGGHTSESAAVTKVVPRTVACRWYEPPVASRRHLYMPVRRMPGDDINKLL
ncbi:MAG: DUF1743 domain-containing protein [Methanobacteriota archaeon]|nr:MAG: DUF1743 domain-containing protein [Euryarchaeota archaeon]